MEENEMLPKRFFAAPFGPEFKSHYNWGTDWDFLTILSWTNAGQFLRLVPLFASARTGPRSSQFRPALAICIKYKTDEHRGPPKWVVVSIGQTMNPTAYLHSLNEMETLFDFYFSESYRDHLDLCCHHQTGTDGHPMGG
ncbi:hypothetical protein D9757_014628 [Collybiopsis confluens]|uniref:Uncharacterized protein n=1 Tax=Collybiopsis confluens TaxID=2823264 RepID=A0A8H5CGG5_9AGAR|nr:hypothetical protein D9757_014628 [Collybiopsis confluens]